MIPISKKQEFEMIKSLIQSKKDLYEVDLIIEYCGSSHPNFLPLMQQKREIKFKIKKLTEELHQIDQSRAGIEIKECLLKKFNEMKGSINGAVHNYPISRSQSTILENFFISKIEHEINLVINCEFRGLITPFLYYTLDKNDSIDRKLIIDFINNEIYTINSIEAINYINILDYYDGFRHRLKQLIN